MNFYINLAVFDFFLRERGREEERERNIDAWEIYQSVASCTPPMGTWPTTQACALTGNWTGDLLVGRPLLNAWATPARWFFSSFKCVCEWTYSLLSIYCRPSIFLGMRIDGSEDRLGPCSQHFLFMKNSLLQFFVYLLFQKKFSTWPVTRDPRTE